MVWAGTWRVGGVLAVSRSFGNRMMKQVGGRGGMRGFGWQPHDEAGGRAGLCADCFLPWRLLPCPSSDLRRIRTADACMRP